MQSLLSRLLPVNIHFEVRPVQEAWRFKMDPSQAQQIVMNLVLNARDAITGEGRIELRTENRVVDGRPVAVLCVRDDGAGMDAATLDHIFEPFFTTRGRERGTGLGLATVHSVTESCGGVIEVESDPGKGTTSASRCRDWNSASRAARPEAGAIPDRRCAGPAPGTAGATPRAAAGPTAAH